MLTDKDFLTARLAELGGSGAHIAEHSASADLASFRLRHGIDSGDLPPAVRTLVGGDITIDRQETWRREGDGDYRGEVTVTVPGMPGELRGQQRLHDSGAGSVLAVDGELRVPIPLVGGKVEETVAGHLRDLLDRERTFTRRRLDSGPSA